MATTFPDTFLLKERRAASCAGERISVGQRWQIGILRKNLRLAQNDWARVIAPYRVRTTGDLTLRQADHLMEVLTAAWRLRRARPERVPDGSSDESAAVRQRSPADSRMP